MRLSPLRLSSGVRLYLLAGAFYALLAFIILHGLIFTNGTHAGGFDYFNYNWNFWWIRHALTNGLNIYVNDMVLAPHTVNFGYHALTAFWYPVWAVFEPFVGTLTAMNVIIFLMCFLNGYILFVLLIREGVAPALALIGGVMLQASPVSRYFYYNNHINLGDWFWLPANILLWQQIVRAVEQGSLRRALIWAGIQGVALWGVGHTDLQFPIFVGFWLVPYGLWTLMKPSSPTPLPHGERLSDAPIPLVPQSEGLKTVLTPPLCRPRGGWGVRLHLILAGLVVLVVAGLLLWFAGPLPHMLDFTRDFRGELAPGTVEDRPGIPFPRGYFWLDAVWWWWNTPTLGANALILLIATLLISLTRWRSRLPKDRWFWLIVLLPPLILSMGPTLNLFGVSIPMPFRIMHSLTDGNFRMPWRLAPIFVAAAAVFIGKSWTPLLPPPISMRVFPLVAILLLIGLDVRLYETAPIGDYIRPVLQPYTFYEQIGRETGAPYDRQAILEVPTGAGTGEVLIGPERAIQYQYYSMTHHKRTLNGFISRAPVEFFYPIRYDDALLAWLGQRRLLEPDIVEPELQRIISEWPVGYIVVHQDEIGRYGPTPQEIIGYFNALNDLLCPVWIERDAVVYRTAWHPDGCPARTPLETEPGVYTIDIGSSGDERYIGWGWHWPETVGGATTWRWTGEYPDTKLYLDLPPGDYQVSLAAQAFAEPRELQVLVNGHPLSNALERGLGGEVVQVTTDTLQTFTFTLTAEVVGQGKHLTLTLAYDSVIVPRDIGQSDDPRKLAIAVDWVRFERAESP